VFRWACIPRVEAVDIRASGAGGILVKVDSAVGKFPEGSALLDLGGSLSVLEVQLSARRSIMYGIILLGRVVQASAWQGQLDVESAERVVNVRIRQP
jgi:hypothetical protein